MNNLDWDSLFVIGYLVFCVVGLVTMLYLTRND